MSDTPVAPPPPPPSYAPPPPAGPPPAAPRPRLTRSRTDRKVAGVCGGLGAYFGVDPVIIRILIVVLTIFGGSGLLLYAAGWLLIPNEDDEQSVVQGWFDRGGFGPVLAGIAVAVGVLLVLIALVGLTSNDHVWFGGGPDLWPLVVVAGIAGAVWYSRRRPPGYPAAPAGSAPPPPPSSVTTPPPPMPAPIAAEGTPMSTVTEPLPPAPPPTDPYAYQPPAPPGPPPGAYAYQPPPPSKPRKVRERSVLGPLTFSTLLIASGVMVLIDRSSRWDIHPAAFLGVLLGITGIGLVVGGWVGRSRGLIGLGVVLALLTAIASAVPAVGSHRTGEVHWTPTSAAAVPADGYHWAAGDVRLDLRQLAAPGDASVRAELGAGTMIVTVPATTRLVVHAHVGLGSLQLPGQIEDDGVGRQSDVTIVPPLGTTSAGTPTTLTLTLKVGLGQLEVQRAQA